MKSLLIVSLMILSAPSFAKLAVYNSEDAAKLVLTSTETLDKIYQNSNTDNFKRIEVENTKLNEFDVLVETTKLDWRCETIVKVKAVGQVITTPNGGKIATNKLVIGKVAKSDCVE